MTKPAGGLRQLRLAAEREMLHPLPAEPLALALGEERLAGDDQTVRFGSVRYSTPPGHAGTRVWCRAAGEELVITARGDLTAIARTSFWAGRRP